MTPTIPISLQNELEISSQEGACRILTNGLINQTWICQTACYPHPVILQQINNQVFKNPLALIQNHQHLYQTWNQQQTSYSFKIAAPLPFPNNSFLHYDQSGKPWRMQEFIDNTVSITKPSSANQLYEAALSFGEFAKMAQEIEYQTLFTTLDKFHDLEHRYKQFQTAKRNGNTERIKEATTLIKQLEKRIKYVEQFENITKAPQQFPTRIRHHDAKITNLLFHQSSNKVAAILDLDTTMPGYFFSDLGDMIRSMASNTQENYTALHEIRIDEQAYEAIISGYQYSLEKYCTPDENAWIHWSGIWIIFMQCLRFITDYFSDDIYYKIEYPRQNWDRAWNQFYLLEALEQHLQKKYRFTPDNY